MSSLESCLTAAVKKYVDEESERHNRCEKMWQGLDALLDVKRDLLTRYAGHASNEDDLQRIGAELATQELFVQFDNKCHAEGIIDPSSAFTLDLVRRNTRKIDESLAIWQCRFSSCRSNPIRGFAPWMIDNLDLEFGKVVYLGVKLTDDEILHLRCDMQGLCNWEVVYSPDHLHISETLVALNQTGDILALLRHLIKIYDV